MTSFLENPADYLGESVTVRHALVGDRGIKVCDCDEVCASLVIADGPLAGRDVRDPWDPPYQPRHDYAVPGYPYLVYVSGIRVEMAQ